MKQLIIAGCVGLLTFHVLGTTYKLKTSVTVDVLDYSDKVVETKRLKAGTKIEIPEGMENKDDKTTNHLKPSGMSVQEFRKTKPTKGAIFRAKIEPMTHAYASIFVGKEKSIIGYRVAVCREDGSFISYLGGYVQKMSKVGKELRLKVKDGEEKMVYIKVKPIKQSYDDNVVMIDEVEFL